MTESEWTPRWEPPGGEELDAEECWRLLAAERFGRLAVAVAGDLDVYPVDFVVDGADVVFRSAEGTKLLEMVMADEVVLEADHRDTAAGRAWSVVAHGVPQLLERFDDIYAAQRLDIRTFGAARRENFVRVRVTRISGRRFGAT